MATKKKTKTQEQPKQDWKASFLAKFPQYAPLIDGGPGEAEARRIFGTELVDLIYDVGQNPDKYDFTSQAGIDAFNGRVFATPYYQQTSKSKKDFDSLEQGEKDQRVQDMRRNIAASYGDLGLTVSELDRVSSEAARSGLQGLALTQFVNSAVGGRARGRQDLLGGLDAQELRSIAKAYNYNPDDLDDQIVAAVTGKTYGPTGTVITADTIREKGKQMAKAAYFHLSPQLDSGLTLQDIFSPYKKLTAQILEKPENDIMMDNPLYSMALGTSATGPMSLAEWEKTVRTDKRFGFQYTEKAKRDATTLGLAISRAFGKIK